jgi:hypothetical protein
MGKANLLRAIFEAFVLYLLSVNIGSDLADWFSMRALDGGVYAFFRQSTTQKEFVGSVINSALRISFQQICNSASKHLCKLICILEQAWQVFY